MIIKKIQIYLTLLIPLTLIACSNDKEEILQGKRIPILLESFSLEANPELANVKINISPSLANSNWQQSGGSVENLSGNFAFSHNYKLIWKKNIGKGVSEGNRITAEPIIVQDQIFVMDSNYKVSALHKHNGNIKWTKKLPNDGKDSAFGGGLAFYKGQIFIAEGRGEVFALNAENGNIIWQHSLITPIRSNPTVANDILLITGIDNRTIAFNALDGSILWTHQGFQEHVGVVGTGRAAIQNGVAIVPYSSGEVFALRLADGAVIWQHNLSISSRASAIRELADISANPVIQNNNVFAVSNGGRLLAINNGENAWELRLGSRETPAVSGNYIFIITNSSQLLAIRTDTGQVHWQTQLQHWSNKQGTQGNILHWRGPILLGDLLLLTNQKGDFILVSPFNGEIQKEFRLDGTPATRPAIAEGRIYFLYADGTLAAYR